MNDQCHDCKIRKLCYLEEPKEDWTCDHYEPCEYDEEDATDINVGDKDTISRKAAIEALTKDKKALEHIINEMSGYEKEFDRFVGQRNQVDYDIYAIKQLPPAQPEQLGTNLAEVGTDCISRQAAIDGKICIQRANGVEIYDDYVVPVEYLEQLPPAQPEIIRCKDCKHWIPYDWMFSEVWRSKNMTDYPEDEIGCNWCDMAMKANDFCSRGERREVTK